MTGLTGGGYPTGYRNSTGRMHSMSSRDTATRLRYTLDNMTFIGPRDLRTPARTRSNDLRSSTPKSSDHRITVTGRGNRLSGSTVPEGTTWRELDQARLEASDYRTIDLTKDEYREVKQHLETGKYGRAFRSAYRAARGKISGKDWRLDAALSIIEAILNASGLLSKPDFKWPDLGYTNINGPCPDHFPEIGSSLLNWGNACIRNQAGVGTSTSFEMRRVALSATRGYRLGLSLWQRASTEGRGHHVESRETGWISGADPGAGNRPSVIVRPGGMSRPQVDPMPQGSARAGRDGGGFLRFKEKQQEKLPSPSKEEKGKYAISLNGRAWYGRLTNGVTEGLDLLDITYDALDKKCGAKTPQDKLACILKNYKSLNGERFIAGLVENQIEDYAWGRLGQISGKAARKAGRSTGYQTGPWDTEFSYHQRGMGLDVSFW